MQVAQNHQDYFLRAGHGGGDSFKKKMKSAVRRPECWREKKLDRAGHKVYISLFLSLFSPETARVFSKPTCLPELKLTGPVQAFCSPPPSPKWGFLSADGPRAGVPKESVGDGIRFFPARSTTPFTRKPRRVFSEGKPIEQTFLASKYAKLTEIH